MSKARTQPETPEKPHMLALIVPFYNFGRGVDTSLQKIAAWHKESRLNALVYLVDDGSTDRTGPALEAFHRENLEWTKLLRLPENRGKGFAVKRAALEIAPFCEYFVFTDCDLHYGLDIIQDRILPALANNEIVIADRSWCASRSHQAISRRMSSYIFNRITGMLTGVVLRDSQAGMKGFRAELCLPIFELLRTDGFAFDVEILGIATFYRFRVCQIPVRFDASYASPETSTIRLLRTSLKMIAELIAVNLRWKRGLYFHPQLEARVDAETYTIRL